MVTQMSFQTMQSTILPVSSNHSTTITSNSASGITSAITVSNPAYSNNSFNNVKIKDVDITVSNCTITVDGTDVVEAMLKISRLNSILLHKPTPDLLNKYQALKDAYENYCVIEALVLSGENKDD